MPREWDMNYNVGEFIQWKGAKGRIRARVETVDGGQATVRLLKRGQPGDTLREVRFADLPELEQAPEPAVELFSYVAESAAAVTPEIPLPADVDLGKLRKVLGENLRFITLPIGKAGVTSRNGNTYGRRAMERLVAQVNEKRPEGRWGHLAAEELGSRYEPPAVRWLAAVLDKAGIAWGKAVALTAEAVRHFEAAEATHARVGTSIFGLEPTREGEEITDLRLVTVDLANAERVGVPQTAAHPYITTEMGPEEHGSSAEEAVAAAAPQEQDQTTIEKEETTVPPVSDVRVEELITAKAQLSEQVTTLEKELREMRTQVDDLNAVRELLKVEDGADIVKAARAYIEERDEIAGENAALLDKAMDASIADMVKVESARPIVKELVIARKPLTRKQLDRALAEVVARDSVKTLIAEQVVAQSGPSQSRPVEKNGKDPESWRQLLGEMPEPKEV